MRQLKNIGVDEVILAVGYMSELFKAFFGNGLKHGIQVEYIFEEKPLGTAGPLSLAMDRLADYFLVMNGEFHNERKSDATIGVYHREVKIDFGVIESNDDNKLIKYTEKPIYQFDVSMGIYAMNRDAICPYLNPSEYLDIPDLILNLRNNNHTVYTYKENCEWLDIGRVEDYKEALKLFDSKQKEFLKK